MTGQDIAGTNNYYDLSYTPTSAVLTVKPKPQASVGDVSLAEANSERRPRASRSRSTLRPDGPSPSPTTSDGQRTTRRTTQPPRVADDPAGDDDQKSISVTVNG